MRTARLPPASPVSLPSSPITIGTIDVGSLGPQTSLNLSTRKATVTFTLKIRGAVTWSY